MSEAWQIMLTSCLTVFGAIVVLVAGQIITKFHIEPIHEQLRLIGEIADSLVFYANVYSNPEVAQEKKRVEASEVFRRHASQLRAKSNAIPWYQFWQSLIRGIPKDEDVQEAAKSLIGLSNSIRGPDDNAVEANRDRCDNIVRRLRIHL